MGRKFKWVTNVTQEEPRQLIYELCAERPPLCAGLVYLCVRMCVCVCVKQREAAGRVGFK